MTRSPALLLALALAACRGAPSTAEPDAAPPTSTAAPPTRKGVSDFPEDPEAPPIAKLGPAPSASAVSREAREKAVLDLLAGKLPAHQVEHVATDPGRTFDASLHRRLSRPKPKVRMTIGQVTAKEIEAEAVRRAVQREETAIKACYHHGLGLNPSLQGRVGVKLVVDAEGKITNTEDAGSDVPDAGVLQCIRAALRVITLPKPTAAPASITVPIGLSPE